MAKPMENTLDAWQVNRGIQDAFGIPGALNTSKHKSILQTVDLNLRPGDYPELTATYIVVDSPPATPIKDTYDEVYKLHYKYLTKNHMAEDRARRLATIYAVQHTWEKHNA